ncbi:unnamed protein product [Amoebophrya sp. A25]|nr:unnamed protein product [Amoebophrya sp. A25]|eukprot:GSA25T00020889001.1
MGGKAKRRKPRSKHMREHLEVQKSEVVLPLEQSPASGDLSGRPVERLQNNLWNSFENVLHFDSADTRHQFRDLCIRLHQTKKQAYWKAREAKPANVFERLADQIFDFYCPAQELSEDEGADGVDHVRASGKKSINSSPGAPAGADEESCVKSKRTRGGAEWWVQVREMGSRSRLYAGEQNDDMSLGFHWDLDYENGTCPKFGTVTYLDDIGAPTVALELGRAEPEAVEAKRKLGKRKPSAQKNSQHSWSVPSAAVSHPVLGKHFVFRGDLLHGVPIEYARRREDGFVVHGGGAGGGDKVEEDQVLDEEQNDEPKAKRAKKCGVVSSDNTKDAASTSYFSTPSTFTKRACSTSTTRVTFLVNIWPDSEGIGGIRSFADSKQELEQEPNGSLLLQELLAETTSSTSSTTRKKSSSSCSTLDEKKVWFRFPGARSEDSTTTGGAGTTTSVLVEKDEPLPVHASNRNTVVCGLSFDNGEAEQYQLWLPIVEEATTTTTTTACSSIRNRSRSKKMKSTSSRDNASMQDKDAENPSRPSGSHSSSKSEAASSSIILFQGGNQAPCKVVRHL